MGTAAATLVPAEMEGGEWGGGSGRSPGALGGRLGTREPLASHLSGWRPRRGLWERAPGGREEGQGCVADVAVPLELSSGKWSGSEVVGPLPVWESEAVERGAREVPRASKSQEERCAHRSPGRARWAGRPALCQSTEEARGPGRRWVGAGTAQAAWHRLWCCVKWGGWRCLLPICLRGLLCQE